MNISQTTYDPYQIGMQQVQGIQGMNQTMQKPTGPKATDETQGMDQYVPSMMQNDIAMPSANYNANAMMVNDVRPVNTTGLTVENLQPVNATNTDSSVNTDLKTTASDTMSVLSSTFRANADSIQSTMDELGLTIDDLSDKENLTALANAMNSGAEEKGLPTISNLDDAVSSLYDAMQNAQSETVDETESADSASGSSSGSGGSGGSSSESEVSTEIVTINGVTYLETTTTEGGVETTTRTVLSGATEI